jgi:hypothetical protein
MSEKDVIPVCRCGWCNVRSGKCRASGLRSQTFNLDCDKLND